jgi:hypothetical protein
VKLKVYASIALRGELGLMSSFCSSLVPSLLLEVDHHNQTPQILLIQSAEDPEILIVNNVIRR